MKINLYNSASSYSVSLCAEDDDLYDAPAPFENINDALAYCEEEIDVRQQAISAIIWDTLTGELYVTCGRDEIDTPEEDYSELYDDYWDDGCPNDDVDESFYDPYTGCDMYEVEPFDFGGDF